MYGCYDHGCARNMKMLLANRGGGLGNVRVLGLGRGVQGLGVQGSKYWGLIPQNHPDYCSWHLKPRFFLAVGPSAGLAHMTVAESNSTFFWVTEPAEMLSPSPAPRSYWE